MSKLSLTFQLSYKLSQASMLFYITLFYCYFIYKYYSLLEEESSHIIFSTISYSLMFVKPVPPKKSTQSWQWQFHGFHFRIFFLKDDKVLTFLIFGGIEFQITGPNYRTEPLPNLAELILGIQSFWGPCDHKPYNDSFK